MQNQMSRFTTIKISKFIDLKNAYVENADLEKAKSMTAYVDALLFKAHTLEEIINFVEQARELKFKDNKDFRSAKRLQAHINYRIKHDKIKVTYNKRTKKMRYTAINA